MQMPLPMDMHGAAMPSDSVTRYRERFAQLLEEVRRLVAEKKRLAALVKELEQELGSKIEEIARQDREISALRALREDVARLNEERGLVRGKVQYLLREMERLEQS